MKEKVPSHAKKVFSGIRFDVYQWEQELYDGSFTTFERARFQDGAFVIAVLPDNRILMTIQEQPARSGPYYSLPGGGFDTPEEDPLDCAKRELFEETGYKSDEWELWLKEEGTSNIIVNTYFYIARGCMKIHTHKNPDHGEKISLEPMDFDAFLELCQHPQFQHWTLLPHMFRAKIDTEAYHLLKKKLLGI